MYKTSVLKVSEAESLRRSVLRPSVNFSPDVIPATPAIGSDYGASPVFRNHFEAAFAAENKKNVCERKLRKLEKKSYKE